VPDNTLLPLEKFAKEFIENNPDKLPDRTTDYWARYTHLLGGLRDYVYDYINPGLSSLSKSPGIYTDHGPKHFDEVIRYAGLLLGLPDKQDIGLEPYELYLLLCAIRLHDAGNIDGRDDHEKRVSYMLTKYGGNIARDPAEIRLISQIAEAHGGTTISGDKDTIAQLPQDGCPVVSITCRPRQVAALVRFSDEICEHRSRAAIHHVESNTLPDDNKLFHYYAASIVGAVPSRTNKNFKLHLAIDTKYLSKKYQLPMDGNGTTKEKYLIDEVLDRIEKLDLERRYCNQFLDPSLQINLLEIQIVLNQSKSFPPPNETLVRTVEVGKYEFRIPLSNGYPESQNSWRITKQELQGRKLSRRAKKDWI
jgi:hypothetical protein